jgi:hypothetical protein
MASLVSVIAKAKTITYRVQGVPVDFDEDVLQSILQELLNLDETAQIDVQSLCPSLYPDDSKVATFTFKGQYHRLDIKNDNTEWEFIHFLTLKENGKVRRIKVKLVIDCHFLGFTPLNECTEEDQDQVE